MTETKNLYSPPNDWYGYRREQDDGYGGDTRPLVFLAGPILGAEDWQSKAVEIIHSKDSNIIIANPRRAQWEAVEPGQYDYEFDIQVLWETNHLRLASAYGAIMFWLAKETTHIPDRAFAQTSRFEFAEWFTHYKYRKIHNPDNPLKLILGVEEGFPGRKYILSRVFEDCPEFIVSTTLEDTCQLMMEKLK